MCSYVRTIVLVWSYMSVCVHVYLCAHTPGDARTQLHLRLCANKKQIWVCLCVNTIVHVCIYGCVHACACMGAHAWDCAHIPTLHVSADVHSGKSVHGFVCVNCMQA